MMLPRERLSLGLLFAGIAIIFVGAIVAIPRSNNDDRAFSPAVVTGTWHDEGAPSPEAHHASPWMIASGIGLLAAADFVRPR
jgi:hypothetical protein